MLFEKALVERPQIQWSAEAKLSVGIKGQFIKIRNVLIRLVKLNP